MALASVGWGQVSIEEAEANLRAKQEAREKNGLGLQEQIATLQGQVHLIKQQVEKLRQENLILRRRLGLGEDDPVSELEDRDKANRIDGPLSLMATVPPQLRSKDPRLETQLDYDIRNQWIAKYCVGKTMTIGGMVADFTPDPQTRVYKLRLSEFLSSGPRRLWVQANVEFLPDEWPRLVDLKRQDSVVVTGTPIKVEILRASQSDRAYDIRADFGSCRLVRIEPYVAPAESNEVLQRDTASQTDNRLIRRRHTQLLR